MSGVCPAAAAASGPAANAGMPDGTHHVIRPGMPVPPRASQWPANRAYRATAILQRGRPVRIVPHTAINLTFGPADSRFANSGDLNANAGCNQMSGHGRLAGGRLLVPLLTSTQMACAAPLMRQEQLLASVLTGRPTYRLTRTQLVLRRAGTELRFALVLHPIH